MDGPPGTRRKAQGSSHKAQVTTLGCALCFGALGLEQGGLYACVRRGGVELAAAFGGVAEGGAPFLAGAPIEREQAIPLRDECLFDRQLTAEAALPVAVLVDRGGPPGSADHQEHAITAFLDADEPDRVDARHEEPFAAPPLEHPGDGSSQRF